MSELSKLRKKVTFEMPHVTQNAAGGNVIDWQSQGQAWAEIKPISGDQFEPQDTRLVTGQKLWHVTIRYADMPTLRTSWRIIYKGQKLYINGVYNEDERDRFLILQCRSDSK